MSSIYATPRTIDSLEECLFYQTIELPEYGLMKGMWDLRAGVEKYMGHVPLHGKRVLEMGPSSGYLSFHMEQQGAEVVAFELAPGDPPDLVPFARADNAQRAKEFHPWMDKFRNAFWFSHRLLNSDVRVVYGNIYSLPEGIGPVDVATFGSILLHLRDPFTALEQALRFTQETVVVTDVVWNWKNLLRYRLPGNIFNNHLTFYPIAHLSEPATTWWHISPQVIQKMIAVLGFEESHVLYHRQWHQETNRKVLCYTVVGHRTVSLP